jgi:hypothetical protein
VRDGFFDADKGVLDSIKDLQRELKRPKFISVRKEEEADLVLIVVSRGIGEPAGAVGVPIGGAVFLAPVETCYVETLLKVGTYEKAITGTGDTWRSCARSVYQQVDSWAAANRDRLPER